MTFADLFHKFFLLLWDNKQKLSATAMAVLSILQLSPELRELMEPKTYSIAMLSISVLMVIFASMGGATPVSRISPSQRLPALLMAGMGGLLALMLVGCGLLENANPVKPAIESGRPDLVAYAIEGSYTIVQGKALEIARDPATPAAVKNAIITVAERANPILDKMRPLADEATDLKDRIAQAGEAEEDPDAQTRARLAVVLADLDRLLTEVSPMINDLLAAMSGDQGD